MGKYECQDLHGGKMPFLNVDENGLCDHEACKPPEPTQLDRIERELTISRNENRMILDRLDKLLTPKKRKPRAAKKHEYDPKFELIWKDYPSTYGSSKIKAYAAYQKRLSESERPLELQVNIHVAVINYAAYIKATGRYPKLVETFLGPSKHYENDWTIPKQPKDPAEINSPIHDAVDFAELKAAEKRLDPVDPYADLKEQNDG